MPAIKGLLAVGQIEEGALVQQFGFEGAMEAFVFAQGLRVRGPGMTEGNAQADEPDGHSNRRESSLLDERPENRSADRSLVHGDYSGDLGALVLLLVLAFDVRTASAQTTTVCSNTPATGQRRVARGRAGAAGRAGAPGPASPPAWSLRPWG